MAQAISAFPVLFVMWVFGLLLEDMRSDERETEREILTFSLYTFLSLFLSIVI